MIHRATVFAALIILLIGYALITPPPTPQPSEKPRWVKINHHGQKLDAWKGPWHCVHDITTGLMWEVKSYAEDLHDKQCSFSWFDGRTGAPDKGDCFVEGSGVDTHDLITHANARHLCGTTRWRLPTANELTSLLISDPLPGDLLIARDYFPYTQRGNYWTKESGKRLTGHFRRYGHGAVSISFIDGRSMILPYRDAAFVRLVATVE